MYGGVYFRTLILSKLVTRQVKRIFKKGKNMRFKRKVLSAVVLSSILLASQASTTIAAEGLTKEKIYELYGDTYSINHLDEITFNELFSKPFYKKSYFSGVILATTVVVAGTVVYFTAGAGAPVAATGVSTVASAVGGGGAGSYMAGLSAVGSVFGGNAMLGSAILNGVSITVSGGAAGATLSLATKVATMTTLGLTGVAFLPGAESGTGKYIFDLRIPEAKIGSGSLRKLTKSLSDTQDDINDALQGDDEGKVKALVASRDEYYKQAISMLKEELNKPSLYTLTDSISTLNDFKNKSYLFQSPENLMVLSVIAYRSGGYDLFQAGIKAARKNLAPFEKGINDSYLNYLEGVSELMKENSNFSFVQSKFESSWAQESYALESAIALITIKGDDAKNDKVKLAEIASLTDKAADQFNSNKYNPRASEVGLYFNTASIYMKVKDYSSALKYFKKAGDSIGMIAKYWPGDGSTDMVNNIRVMEAVCLFHLNKGDKAAELFNKIMKDYEGNPEKTKMFKAIYQGA